MFIGKHLFTWLIVLFHWAFHVTVLWFLSVNTFHFFFTFIFVSCFFCLLFAWVLLHEKLNALFLIQQFFAVQVYHFLLFNLQTMLRIIPSSIELSSKFGFSARQEKNFPLLYDLNMKIAVLIVTLASPLVVSDNGVTLSPSNHQLMKGRGREPIVRHSKATCLLADNCLSGGTKNTSKGRTKKRKQVFGLNWVTFN